MARKWELIGTESPVGAQTSDVPGWVTDALSRMYERHPGIFRTAEAEGRRIFLTGKNYRYAITCEGQAGQYRSIYRRKRVDHATALVVRDERVLLVRNKGRRRYSLPGGAIEEEESGRDALVRHLKEQTNLKVRGSYLLFNYKSRANRHRVFRVEAVGNVRVRRKVLDSYAWWDVNSELPVRDSAREIIAGARLKSGRRNQRTSAASVRVASGWRIQRIFAAFARIASGRRIRKTRAAFGLVVNERNEILLIQRGYGWSKGKWSLPGAHADKGERLQETAIRETREETGIWMSADVLYHRSERHGFEVWRGRRMGGRRRVQRRECMDAQWFKADMLPHDDSLAFGPDSRAIGKWAAENPGSRRVHYPRSKMRRAGFGLVVNSNNEVLLIERKHGTRKGKWSIPGGDADKRERRRDTAIRETLRATGIDFAPDSLYYQNRFGARIWIGKPLRSPADVSGGRWFAVNELPDEESLGFAIDVRTIEKCGPTKLRHSSLQGVIHSRPVLISIAPPPLSVNILQISPLGISCST